jgi:hypothetical protein
MCAQNDTDTVIMKILREPIDELVNKYCQNLSLENRMRLRQLPWYAVDILLQTNDIPNLKHNEVIQRIINDIRLLGASEQFINDSLDTAISIYNTMKTEYPGISLRYKG